MAVLTSVADFHFILASSWNQPDRKKFTNPFKNHLDPQHWTFNVTRFWYFQLFSWCSLHSIVEIENIFVQLCAVLQKKALKVVKGPDQTPPL